MRLHAAIALLLAVGTFALFFQVRNHEFVNYDDPAYVVGNPNLAEGLSFESVRRAFAEPQVFNWTPLTMLAFHLDYTLYGLDPAGYLLTNVALHALGALLLFLAFSRMTGSVWPSAFVAAIFAVHPLHVESVAWVSERKDVLSGVFWMLVLCAYVRYAERPESKARYLLVLSGLALGLLAKPMLVTLPFVLLLLDYWPLGRLRKRVEVKQRRRKKKEAPSAESPWGLPDAGLLRRAVVEKLPLLLLVAAACVVTLAVQRSSGAASFGDRLPIGARLANAVESYVIYVVKSVWPSGLTVIYPHPFPSLDAARAGAAAALLVATTALVGRVVVSRPYLAVGWLWYLGTLVPVIGLVQVGMQARADRYMYLPLIGLSVMVAWGAIDVAARWRIPKAALAAAGAAAIAALSASTWVQLQHWRDSRALFARALAVTEKNFIAHHWMAMEFYKENQLREAEAHFTAAVQLRPPWAPPYLGLAGLLAQRGELDRAMPHFRQARHLEPDRPRAYSGLGYALLQARRYDEAQLQFERALSLGGESAELHMALARIAVAKGRLEEAISHERKALELDPGNPSASNHLAWILATCENESLRDPEEAIRIAGAAVLQHGEEVDPSLLDTLAAAYAGAGQFQAAIRIAQNAAERAAASENLEAAEEIRSRLALYRAGRPYIEPSRASGD